MFFYPSSKMPEFHVGFSKKFGCGDLDANLPTSGFLNRFQEKGNLEVLLFTIQSRMRANNQKVYTPHDGKLVSDINRVQQCFPLCIASGLAEFLIRVWRMVTGQG